MRFVPTVVCALAWAAPLSSQGLCSASVSLGGANEHVRIANHGDLQPAAAVTYEAWFRAERVRGRIVSKGDGWGSTSNRTFDLTLGSNGKLSAEFFLKTPSGRGYVPIGSAPVIKLLTWTHVAATFDSAKQEAALYINAVQVGKKATPKGATQFQSTTPLFFGGTPPHSIYFKGQINQVRIWNKALTAAELKVFSQLETEKLPGVVAQWPLDGHLFDLKSGHDGLAQNRIGWLGGCATRTNYHAGTRGPFGVPSLTASANPVLNSTIFLQSGNASGAPASGALAVGLQPARIAVAGGTVLVQPVLVLPVPIAAAGWRLPLTIPNNASLSTAPLFLQLVVGYPGKTGLGFSPGLQLMFGR